MPFRGARCAVSSPAICRFLTQGKAINYFRNIQKKVGKIFAGFEKFSYLCNAFKRRP